MKTSMEILQVKTSGLHINKLKSFYGNEYHLQKTHLPHMYKTLVQERTFGQSLD